MVEGQILVLGATGTVGRRLTDVCGVDRIVLQSSAAIEVMGDERLTGPRALSFAEALEVIGQAVGHRICFDGTVDGYLADFVVLSLHFAPGGTTGWHSHPGPAMAIVQEGTFTLYNASDRKCRPHRYGPGQAFVDRGGGNVHIGRNETGKPVRVLVTFVIPQGAQPTIDAPDPGTCRF